MQSRLCQNCQLLKLRQKETGRDQATLWHKWRHTVSTHFIKKGRLHTRRLRCSEREKNHPAAHPLLQAKSAIFFSIAHSKSLTVSRRLQCVLSLSSFTFFYIAQSKITPFCGRDRLKKNQFCHFSFCFAQTIQQSSLKREKVVVIPQPAFSAFASFTSLSVVAVSDRRRVQITTSTVAVTHNTFRFSS